MKDTNRAGVVSRAIAERLTADGTLPQGATVNIEHATVARIQVLYPDGSDEMVFEHVWSEGIDPDTHFALADRMVDEARRRRRV